MSQLKEDHRIRQYDLKSSNNLCNSAKEIK